MDETRLIEIIRWEAGDLFAIVDTLPHHTKEAILLAMLHIARQVEDHIMRDVLDHPGAAPGPAHELIAMGATISSLQRRVKELEAALETAHAWPKAGQDQPLPSTGSPLPGTWINPEVR